MSSGSPVQNCCAGNLIGASIKSMFHPLNMRAWSRALLLPLLLAIAVGSAIAQNSPSVPVARVGGVVTNLAGLIQLIDRNQRIVGDVALEGTVCASADSSIGAIILQDATDTALIELSGDQPAVEPGEKIRIEGKNCLLRRRDMGVKISAVPVVDNDGIHGATNRFGEVRLTAGRHPLRLEWFNQLRDFSLDVTWQQPNGQPAPIPASALSHQASVDASGKSVFAPGLVVDCFEGGWQSMPDFELLKAAKSGVATNFDLGFRTRDLFVGLRFKGYLDVPEDGVYTFQTKSDDGSLLFIGDSPVVITKLGAGEVPVAAPAIIGEPMASTAGRWVSVEGRVNFISPSGKGLELRLRSEPDSIRVKIADATRLDSTRLMNSRVRITGVGIGIFNLHRRIVLGDLFAVDSKALKFLDSVAEGPEWTSPLTSARQVQSLPLEDAKRALPVRLQGVVTSMGPPYDRWLAIQDETRGIFVDLHAISNDIPSFSDFCEITGHSGAGDFAPVVVADKIRRLGKGDLPEPAHPAWSELINGSMDVQWVEFQGLVTDVHSNTLSMLLPGGQLDVQVDKFEASLTPFEKSVVRIQGVLFAAWTTSREVRVGNVVMRNANVSVDIPVPADPFDAVLKTPRELLMFDAQATAFRRVKVRGQIVHAEGNQIFLMDDGSGIRLLPIESVPVHAGDLVEAVGYPDISGAALLLREAKIRKTAHAPLPEPRTLTEADMTGDEIDATRVRVEGKLLESHLEQRVPVLGMQSGTHLYLARLPQGESRVSSLRPGSKLRLEGVYVGHGRNQHPGNEAESFELLLNSFGDLVVLSQPSWWTLQRLLIIVGLLLIVLTFAVIWIRQLRSLVEQRTSQLQREIRERERVERQHALEAERARIARDLHDDLGSSLTEINALASTGQRPQVDEASHANLFHAIAGKARSLIAALDVIVWAVDPEDNLLQSLADYLSGYAEEFFSSTNIACRFKVPVSFPKITLEGRVRHDLLMTVKEALNNVVRHAEATEVEFRMAVNGADLEIEIADNGKGIEGSSDKGGHGLKNLSARLIKLGGTCTVASRVSGGTIVRIRLSLSQASSMPDTAGESH